MTDNDVLRQVRAYFRSCELSRCGLFLPQGYTFRPLAELETASAVTDFLIDCGIPIVFSNVPNPLYMWWTDSIEVPAYDDYAYLCHRGFEDALCHEIIHWTGVARRLNRRSLILNVWELEEFVAQLGATLLFARLGIPPDALFMDYMAKVAVNRDDALALMERAWKPAVAAVNYLLEKDYTLLKTPTVCET